MKIIADITRAARGTEASLVSRAQQYATRWNDSTVSVLCYPDQQSALPSYGQGLTVIPVHGPRYWPSVTAVVNATVIAPMQSVALSPPTTVLTFHREVIGLSVTLPPNLRGRLIFEHWQKALWDSGQQPSLRTRLKIHEG